jgi:predicted CXXCH cytochrome family protein
MKNLVLLIAVLAVTGAAATFADDKPKDRGPEVITFKMGVMLLPFRHWGHQKQLNDECYHCHGKNTSGKIPGWGKESAHTICIPCHDLDDKGPIECHQCHKK